jgi:xylulokinase
MAAEVVTGEVAEPLQAKAIEVHPQLGEIWDGAFWHRFHRAIS